MKKAILLLITCVLSLAGFSQKYTEDDVKQFYRTIQGDYTAQLNDSCTMQLHFTPIWEREDDRFHWMYVEGMNVQTKEIMIQKIIEVKPVSDITYKVIVHGIKNPEIFEGRWSNRNFFDGFNKSILKGSSKLSFMKTKDFEYQTRWGNRKSLKCFPKGDRIHFKFVQADERFYIKRVPRQSTHIIGIECFKELTD